MEVRTAPRNTPPVCDDMAESKSCTRIFSVVKNVLGK